MEKKSKSITLNKHQLAVLAQANQEVAEANAVLQQKAQAMAIQFSLVIGAKFDSIKAFDTNTGVVEYYEFQEPGAFISKKGNKLNG